MFTFELMREFGRNVMRVVPGCGPKVYKSDKRIDGQIVVITGANGGVGKETTKDLARRGGKIIMGCRDVTKAQEVVTEILQEVPNAILVVKKLDLSSLESVRAFAEEINREETQIDYLINNAGLMRCPKWSTKDGIEMQFGTNYLGHFLLTMLLLDKIKASNASRIINVSSIAYVDGKIHFDDINLDRNYDPQVSYCQSKLAVNLFTRELARRLVGSNVVTFALHPGVIRSGLHRHFTGFAAFGDRYILPMLQINTWLGCQTTLYCTLDDEIVRANESGNFYVNCGKRNVCKNSTDDEVARKLWDLSCSMVGIESA